MQNKRALVLVLSLLLGVVAALLNWLYLNEKGKGVESVKFVGIAPGARILRGDTFAESHFTPVEIPKNRIGQLDQFAVLFADIHTIIGSHATRNYEEGELVLRSDLKTPPPELNLQPDERAMWIPVDTRTFVPTLVMPGDEVSFIVSKTPAPRAAPPSEEEDDSAPPLPMPVPASGEAEVIGPFKVLSLGNRLGSAEVMRAAGVQQVQENVMTIRVQLFGGQLDPKAQKLWSRLQASDYRQAGVLLHPRKTAK
jgi:hypothetical protein